jgi:hypothetical protein
MCFMAAGKLTVHMVTFVGIHISVKIRNLDTEISALKILGWYFV